MIKDCVMFLIKNYIAKSINLALLLFASYQIGSGADMMILLSIIGFVSLSLVIGALYLPDLSNMGERNESDKKLYNSILETIPFDEKFVYWFDRHNYGTKEYPSDYLVKFFDYFDKFSLDRSKFFHNSQLQHEFEHFMHAVFKFRKSHTSYTVISGDKVSGVDRNGEDYTNDPTWYARVKELNENAAAVFNKYENFSICGKEALML